MEKNYKFGDWYVYEDYSEIRLYGAGVEPYRLPIFVPIRLFSLEFIRKSLNVDQIHFVPMKKVHMFKLLMSVGLFIVNMRQAADEVNMMLDGIHLLLGDKWAYDPHPVISNRRIENGYSLFVHESRSDIMKLPNIGFEGSISSNIQTPLISEKLSKRSKEVVVDSEDEEKRAEKITKLIEDIIGAQPGFSLQLGDEKNVLASPRRHGDAQE